VTALPKKFAGTPAGRGKALLLILSMLLPWFTAASGVAFDGAPVPACCRAHGVQRCLRRTSVDAGPSSASGVPSFVRNVEANEKCPCLPGVTSTGNTLHHGPAAGTFIVLPCTSRAPAAGPTCSAGAVAFAAHYKRGPPSCIFA
jgi:hypothetical protein